MFCELATYYSQLVDVLNSVLCTKLQISRNRELESERKKKDEEMLEEEGTMEIRLKWKLYKTNRRSNAAQKIIPLGLKMGRRKLEIKRIEEKSSREVAFCKRRKGLIKKANQLSILCDVDVALLIISNRGKLHEFSSTNSLTGILQRYETHVEAEKEISAEIQATEPTKYSSTKTGELLQETERQLEATNADGLTVTDLIHLENELQTALMQTRSRKTHLMLESVKALHEKQKLLLEEKKHLEKNRARMKKKRKVNEMPDLPPQRTTLNFL